MTYEETLAHIFSRGRFGIKPGLERISRLLEDLGNPHERLRVVHVAGTNGKGSTAAFLSSITHEAGIRTGLYTSPHLISFTERIRINGSDIRRDTLTRIASRVLATALPDATFFELVTAMALLHFAEEEVELAVMETGMGGRWDATNVAAGILSIITPVSLDHCEYLGATIAEIAEEKAGIIKPGRPTVAAAQPQAAFEMLNRRCSDVHSRYYGFGDSFSAWWDAGFLTYRGVSVELAGVKPGIGGSYQLQNAACALAAAELLAAGGLPLGSAEMRRGIENARWPGRMEIIGQAPRVLLDGAHNPAGAEALADALKGVEYRRLLLIVGVMGDKDADAVLSPLLPLAEHMYAVSPAIDRAMPSARLAQFCRSREIPCSDSGSVANGLEKARESAGEDDLIVVCGSLFTVGEARGILLGENYVPFRG